MYLQSATSYFTKITVVTAMIINVLEIYFSQWTQDEPKMVLDIHLLV